MKKKFIAVFAALCMVISMLGACGNAEGSKETTKPENKETQAQAGETAAGGETGHLRTRQKFPMMRMTRTWLM